MNEQIDWLEIIQKEQRLTTEKRWKEYISPISMISYVDKSFRK